MTDAKRGRELMDSDDRGVATPMFEPAQILLTEPGQFLDLLLSQALFASDAREVPTNKPAHVHRLPMAVGLQPIYQL